MAIQYEPPYLLINGEHRLSNGREMRAVVNPADGSVLGETPYATATDLNDAIAAAVRGFAEWRKVSPYERARVLRKVAMLLRERSENIARFLTLEEGKPLVESRGEVNAAIDVIEWDAEEGRRIYGRVVPARAAGGRYMVLREPIGVVAAFTPWNFPVAFVNRKISAALAAGCAIIIKPAEQTPASSLALIQAYIDAGVPKGAVNVVFGNPPVVATHLIGSQAVRMVSFTGSAETGRRISRLAADGLKPTLMELGGHSPIVICEDADLDQILPLVVPAKYRNAGQMYMAPTRFYVHSSLHDPFVAAFAAAVGKLKIGNGMDPLTTMGPLANPGRMAAMDRLMTDARRRGAQVAAGGTPLGKQGYFWPPTLVTDVPKDALLMNEEPLGPVAATMRFDRIEDLVPELNRIPFGLASFAFTNSIRTAHLLIESIEAGMVGINSFTLGPAEVPFGGIKESGYGSEGGMEGLLPYTVVKFVNYQA